jgi:DNA gyrase/topoisomerase IV subunit A
MVARVVSAATELVAMSQKGQVIRVELSSVPAIGRSTQGVSIMKLRAEDKLASVTCL